MKIEIKSLAGNILFTHDVPDNSICLTVKAAIESGVDLSGANLSDADLRGADLRGADLRDADLSGAGLHGAKLSNSNLSGCDLRNADLRNADLSYASLRDSDLRNASMSNSDLRGCDLRYASLRNTVIDGVAVPSAEEAAPLLKQVAQAALATPDALDMGCWHACETTHCISGWAVALSGDKGKELEANYGSANAGMLLLGIEAATHFYDDDESAREWLQNVLEGEK